MSSCILMWVCSRRYPFSYSAWWIQLFRGEGLLSSNGALVDAWPDFPGLKVGKIYLSSSFLTILGGVDHKSWHSIRSTIIPQLGALLELFSRLILLSILICDSLKSFPRFLDCFFLTWSNRLVEKLISRTTADQACFVLYSSTLSVGKRSNSKIF